VHGTAVIRIESREFLDGPLREADGQATTLYGLAPTVLTADCLPVALAGAQAAAMVHAGWRGLAGGVIEEGVRALRELGDSGPLQAAIGPGARACCYEVGEEVHSAFAERFPHARRGANLDLPAIARACLEAAGVEAIHDVGLCTICSDRNLFFSHRRDKGVTGRQAGIVWRV
jgi:YfiH family protein